MIIALWAVFIIIGLALLANIANNKVDAASRVFTVMLDLFIMVTVFLAIQTIQSLSP